MADRAAAATSVRVSLLVLVASLVGWAPACSSEETPVTSPAPVPMTPPVAAEPKAKAKSKDRAKARHGRGSGHRANVVLVLADDLPWNLVEHMPNVQKMQ